MSERTLAYRSSRITGNKEASPETKTTGPFPFPIAYTREVLSLTEYTYTLLFRKGHTCFRSRIHTLAREDVREIGGSRLWIRMARENYIARARAQVRQRKKGRGSPLGSSGEIQPNAKNVCRDFGRTRVNERGDMTPSDRC